MRTLQGDPQPWVLRLFSGSWTLIFVVLACLLRDFVPLSKLWMVPLAGAGLLAAGLFVPAAMRGPYRLTEKLLAPVGHLLSLLVLCTVYFGVFAVFAAVLRLVGWDPLRRRRHNREQSAWVRCQPGAEVDRYRWQY